MRIATARFLYRFLRPAAVPDEREVVLVDAEQRRAATFYTAGGRGPRPAWVLLHGITVPGRHHAGVRRMARALAAAGHAVLVPEVPRWADLRVTPEDTGPAVSAAAAYLAGDRRVDGARLGVMGLSVAGTWAFERAAAERRSTFRAAVSIGGYADLRRLLRAMVAGEHEWPDGGVERYTPDPYGRWILGAALLPLLDDGAGYGARPAREQAGEALHTLAVTAGRHGALAGEPVYDPLIAQLRAPLPREALPAWDLLAPPSRDLVPDRAAGLALADALAEAGLRAHPALDPAGRLDGMRARALLLHGRYDRLVPASETLRLAALLPPAARAHATVTRLTGHTKTSETPKIWHPGTLAREVRQFAAWVDAMLAALET